LKKILTEHVPRGGPATFVTTSTMRNHRWSLGPEPIIPVQEAFIVVFRLDYLSCVLTVFSTILVGKRHWEGWVLAAVNSVIVCIIGLRTSQLGFIPANVFCIVLYGFNLHSWRRANTP